MTEKMFYCEGFQLNEVKLGTPEREDRTLLVFAWTSYGINVGGWASERVQKERNWRANTVQDQGPVPCGTWAMGNSRWVMWYGAPYGELQQIFATAFRRLTGSRRFGRHLAAPPSPFSDRPHRLAPNGCVFLIPLRISGMA